VAQVDVQLKDVATVLRWSIPDTVNFAWEGSGRYWDTDAGLGVAPTVLEAP
jgi:hypothetical protein